MTKGTDVESLSGIGLKEFFEVVGLNKAIAIDQKAGIVAYKL